MVSDASAVDGINFKMNYSLTTDNNQIHIMVINKNPCQGLDSKYKLGIGCRNPAKIDCANNSDSGWNPKDSCSCKLKHKIALLMTAQEYYLIFLLTNNSIIINMMVVNQDQMEKSLNLLSMTPKILQMVPLKQFCEDIQFNSGDFTTYCYDYNDTSSSPYLRSPYKISVIYTDLD